MIGSFTSLSLAIACLRMKLFALSACVCVLLLSLISVHATEDALIFVQNNTLVIDPPAGGIVLINGVDIAASLTLLNSSLASLQQTYDNQTAEIAQQTSTLQAQQQTIAALISSIAPLTIYHSDIDDIQDALMYSSYSTYTQITGHVYIYMSNQLTSVTLSTVTIGQYLAIESCPYINAISAPLLQSLGQGIDIFGVLPLSAISFPLLTSVGAELAIFNNPTLTFVSVPSLTSVATLIKLCGNAQGFTLPSNLPSLWSVNNTCAIGSTCPNSGGPCM